MPLNVYVLSHPVLKLLSSSIIYETTNEYQCRYVGSLLTYEILRKFIKIKQIYIKCLHETKEICILNSQEKYYIITNLIKNYHMVGDIKNIFPEINILNLEEETNKSLDNENKIKNITNKAHIIVLDIVLHKSSIVEYIADLIFQQKISLTNIHIGCLECYASVLEILGKEYPNLNIYTTKIIKL